MDFQLYCASRADRRMLFYYSTKNHIFVIPKIQLYALAETKDYENQAQEKAAQT